MKKCYLVFVSLLFLCFINETTVKAYTKDYLSKNTLALVNVNSNKDMINDGVKLNKIDKNKNICENNEINLYKEKDDVVEVFSASNQSIYLTKDDIRLMSQIVYAESGAEPYEGKVAVASVILNRTVHPKFPKSIKEVIGQKNAFSCVKNGKITVEPDESSYNAVLDAIKGKDPTNNALFFYNPKTATSSWMKNVNKSNVKVIGNHVFFDVK